MTHWNAALYLKFETERTQPAEDLARRIPCEAPAKILDVGCGPGNSSRVLATRFPKASILGIDSSPAMIEAATAGHPDIAFRLCDAGRDLVRLDQDFDVVFSNACIQWIPDHPSLLRAMLGRLRPGGVLAVQTPMNHHEPIHRIIEELTTADPWRGEFPNPRVFYNLSPEAYFDVLSELAEEVTLWETSYHHILPSHDAIMEWYRGTGLRPYLQALSDEKRIVFEQAVRDRVVEAYPARKNGRVIFRFPRFFFLATAKTAPADEAA